MSTHILNSADAVWVCPSWGSLWHRPTSDAVVMVQLCARASRPFHLFPRRRQQNEITLTGRCGQWCTHTQSSLLLHFQMHMLCGNYHGNCNLTLTCVGSHVSAADSFIVGSSSGPFFKAAEICIYICAVLKLFLVLNIATEGPGEFKHEVMFLRKRSPRCHDQLNFCLPAG